MEARTNTSELESLYREHRTPLVRLAALLTGSRAVAEELVQDSFLKLEGSLDSARKPAAYLRQIVVNEARQHLRRRAVEERHLDEPAAPALPPEIDEVWEALWLLPPRQREVLVLRFYEDMPVRQIAQVIGAPTGTVKSHLHRGLAALREVISREN